MISDSGLVKHFCCRRQNDTFQLCRKEWTGKVWCYGNPHAHTSAAGPGMPAFLLTCVQLRMLLRTKYSSRASLLGELANAMEACRYTSQRCNAPRLQPAVEVAQSRAEYNMPRTAAQVGDYVLQVNGENVVGYPVASIRERIVGPVGSTVRVVFESGRTGQQYEVLHRTKQSHFPMTFTDGSLCTCSDPSFVGTLRIRHRCP